MWPVTASKAKLPMLLSILSHAELHNGKHTRKTANILPDNQSSNRIYACRADLFVSGECRQRYVSAVDEAERAFTVVVSMGADRSVPVHQFVQFERLYVWGSDLELVLVQGSQLYRAICLCGTG